MKEIRMRYSSLIHNFEDYNSPKIILVIKTYWNTRCVSVNEKISCPIPILDNLHTILVFI